MIKLYSTPSPVPNAPNDDTSNTSSQDAGSTNSYLPYSFRNRKFPPYSTTTMKNQKKKENRIDDKVTIDTTPASDAPGTETLNASDQDAGPTNLYLP